MKLRPIAFLGLTALLGCGEDQRLVDAGGEVDLSSPLAVVSEYQRTVNEDDCDGYVALLHPDFEFDLQEEGGKALDQLAGFCTELALYCCDEMIELKVLALTKGDGDRVEVMTDAVLQILVSPDTGWISTTRLGFVLVGTGDDTYRIRSITAYPRI